MYRKWIKKRKDEIEYNELVEKHNELMYDYKHKLIFLKEDSKEKFNLNK